MDKGEYRSEKKENVTAKSEKGCTKYVQVDENKPRLMEIKE